MRKLCLLVPKPKAEEARQKLLAMNLLEKHLAIRKEGESVVFPLRKRVELGFPVEERDFEESFKPITHYSEVVDVPEELRPLLPTSFDVIGDIAIVRLPDELRDYGKAVGAAILKAHTHVRCVLADEGVAGEFRVRRVAHLAGEMKTKTVHREYGLSYGVDVAKAYFSPRLATERMRVAEQVAPGEVVLDLFTGVGPFAIMIAKKREPSIVYAVDNNPAAFELLEENVRRNRADRVKTVLGDAREALKTTHEVDRLILDLPQSVHDFYIDALRSVKPGGILHYYEIMETVELEERKGSLIEEARREGTGVEITGTKEVKTYSPAQKHYVFDVRVSRM